MVVVTSSCASPLSGGSVEKEDNISYAWFICPDGDNEYPHSPLVGPLLSKCLLPPQSGPMAKMPRRVGVGWLGAKSGGGSRDLLGLVLQEALVYSSGWRSTEERAMRAAWLG